MSPSLNRRHFLGSCVAAVASGLITPSSVHGEEGLNQRAQNESNQDALDAKTQDFLLRFFGGNRDEMYQALNRRQPVSRIERHVTPNNVFTLGYTTLKELYEALTQGVGESLKKVGLTVDVQFGTGTTVVTI